MECFNRLPNDKKIDIRTNLFLRGFNVLVDQDFIDTYYVILKVYDDNISVKNMIRLLSKYTSRDVVEFDEHILRNECYDVDPNLNSRTCMNNLSHKDFSKFIDSVIDNYYRIYERCDISKKHYVKFTILDTSKKLYNIKFSLNDVVHINAIAGVVAGSKDTSRRFLSNGPTILLTKCIFDVGFYVNMINNMTELRIKHDILNFIRRK